MINRFYLGFLAFLFLLITVSCSTKPFTETPDDPDNPIEENPDDEEPTEFTFDRLFDDTLYREITIKISESEWDELDDKMHENQSLYGRVKTMEYAKADFYYMDTNGETLIPNVGIRIRGNLSAQFIEDHEGNLNMVHWKINFRSQFNGENPENAKRRGFELKELDLKYNRNQDPSYIAEAYSLEMMENFGVYAQAVSHTLFSIELEGVKHQLGIYTIFEPIDDEFIERRFDKLASDGDLYKSLWQNFGPASLQPILDSNAVGEETLSYHPSYDLKTNEETSNHEPLLDFISKINSLEGYAFKNYIENHFNVEMFLRYMAVNVFLGNPDDYRAMGNNYYLYHDSSALKWYLIPYDFDHSMAQGDVWNPTENFTIGTNIYTWFNQMEINTGNSYYQPILATKILNIPEYLSQYETMIQEILDDEYFTFDYYYARYSTIKELYKDVIPNVKHQVSFSRGSASWYLDDKRTDVSNQLNN